MNKCVPILTVLVFLLGCNATKTNNNTPVSAWRGTYTGQLDFNGCFVTPPVCAGDSIKLDISQDDPVAQDNPPLMITITDSTTGQVFNGAGTALSSVAPPGPGTFGTNATITINLGLSQYADPVTLVLIGDGSSQNSSPVHMQTLVVQVAHSSDLGTLTRP